MLVWAIVNCLCSAVVDIWSVGCIMAELISGKPLFPGNDRILELPFKMRVISFFTVTFCSLGTLNVV